MADNFQIRWQYLGNDKRKRSLITCDRFAIGDWAAGFLDIRMGSMATGDVVVMEM